MNTSDKLLIVEDEQHLAKVLKGELERSGMDVTLAGTAEEALKILQERFDVMLLDLNLPGMSGMDLFNSIRDEPNSPEVVFLTGHGDVENAVMAMKMGAYDFLGKPVQVDRLEMILKKAAEKARIKFDNIRMKEQFQRDKDLHSKLVVISPENEKTFQFAGKVAQTDESVLILGETGVGKDVLARFIHENSKKSTGPFISVNCAAFQETILENELFGHEKGAFTGASARKLGFFEVASDGTLFLDEVVELGEGMQAKLLHVLENGSFYRVGGTRLISTRARVLAATNSDIEDRVTRGSFRQDLYYRLNTFSVSVAPLRNRREEVIPLATLFLYEINAEKRISDEAAVELVSYDWPGNVRELKHVIQRSAVIATGDVIKPEDLHLSAPKQTGVDDQAVPVSLEGMESRHIRKVLESVGWKRGAAAKILEIDPKTLYRKIRKYGIEKT